MSAPRTMLTTPRRKNDFHPHLHFLETPELLEAPEHHQDAPTRNSSPKLHATSLSSSSSDSSSSSFWTTRPSPPQWSSRRFASTRFKSSVTKRRIAIAVCVVLIFAIWTVPVGSLWPQKVVHVQLDHSYTGLSQPIITKDEAASKTAALNPEKWLRENSDNKYAVAGKFAGILGSMASTHHHLSTRPRAALITLVRNSELGGIVHSMKQLEYRWNHKYQYPWIFINDEPFSEDFKAATRNLTSAACYFEVIPKEHWSLPDWIDEDRFMNSLEYLGTIGVGKGHMISYRHMCRWNSGFFYQLPRLQEFDWYWRVEPDVHFFCDIQYDVFRFMRDNALVYGFNMNILDDARSFPSLWSRTRAFIAAHPRLIHPSADFAWLLDQAHAHDYNNCQFFSNFEIGSLDFFRGAANKEYFNWLDRGGGFFYERYGDAPIHTLSVAMFAPKRSTWFFRDIGYQHDMNRHCPPGKPDTCDCEPTPLDENFYKLVPFESPQKKPDDTCIRLFLGRPWLEKKEGYDGAAERAFGGSGYNGYIYSGLEDTNDGPLSHT